MYLFIIAVKSVRNDALNRNFYMKDFLEYFELFVGICLIIVGAVNVFAFPGFNAMIAIVGIILSIEGLERIAD